VKELALFQQGLEDFGGRKVGQDDLRHAIDVYNHTRHLLRDLYESTKAGSPPLSGTQVQQVVLAAAACPREHYNQLLEQLLGEIAGRQGTDGSRPRLMVMGSAYDEPAFTQMIEAAGGLVVADALCFGGRYFWEPVATQGEPLASLARSYLNRPNCARMAGAVPEIADFALAVAREFRVDGIIYQRMRWCDLWGGAVLFLQKKFQEEGMPVLNLEREYALTGVGQLRNRVEAFLETLGG
jgi:benzoyl-CoA reductase/2-hydroxyglutaryl-CoA dehydratase subunit BcrC/BadD/HgdB